MKLLVQALIGWPQQVAQHLYWLAPLVTRLAVGWVFAWSGWGKLTHLPLVTDNFANWGIPHPVSWHRSFPASSFSAESSFCSVC